MDTAQLRSDQQAAFAPAAAGMDRSLPARLDMWFGAAVEALAALLILAETIILLASVTARYALHAPLVWADELAGIIFLWLAMFGAVIALRRSGHMRLTALLALVPAGVRHLLEATTAVAAVLFLLLLLLPSFEYVGEEMAITTPALSLSGGWKPAAFAIGTALMLLTALLHLAGFGRSRVLLKALGIVAAASVLLILAGPLLKAMGNYNLLILFVGVVSLCVAIGVPIAFAFGLATLAYLGLTTDIPATLVVNRTVEGMSHLILLSVPLFIFLGLLIEMTGMARAMVDVLAALLGHVRAGLSYVLLGAMYLVSGISGSKAADMAAIAPILFPEMKKRGARPGELVALLASSAAMSETIPPSLVLITIGSVTDVSIAALFTGGLVPALILAIALAVLARWRAGAEEVAAPPERANGRQIALAFLIALPALALPFVIRAAVVEGVATATEVSTIGIVYTAICGLLIYRRFDWRRLYPMLVDTAALTGAILLIIGTATAMSWALTQSGFSQDLAAAMGRMPGGAMGFLAVSILAFIVLGAVLEGIPALVLFAPLTFPIARMFGIHEVHYAMVIILAMGIGLFAPPIGIGYYTACAIGRVDPDDGMRPIWPYLGALLLALLLVAAFPWLSTGFL